MNLLFYLHQFPAIGGIETVTATLANAFAAQGHQVTLVSHRYTADDCVSTRLNPGIDVLHMPGTENVSSRNTAFLQQTIREKKIDVVIFQDSYVRIEENLFVQGLTVPVVVCEHNAPFKVKVREPRPFSVREFLGRVKFFLQKESLYRSEGTRRRWLYARCSRYVLLSNRFFGEFRAVTRLADTRKLRAIPNPLAPCFVSPRQLPNFVPSAPSPTDNESESLAHLRRRGRRRDEVLQLPRSFETKKLNEIVFAATLDRRKGCDLLLLAWERIGPHFPNWRLTILGDGTERTRLETFAREHGLSNVSFEGYQSNPVPYFQRAKIFAFPSRFEGWGLVLVEAMAQGCVPVAFDSYASVRDIIQDGVNGRIVPAFDIVAYAKAFEELMTNEARWTSAQQAALVTPNRFDVRSVVSEWTKLLAQVGK